MLEVVRTSPLVLPSDSPLRREPPRPPALRPAGYLDKFDATTLAYDVFVADPDKITLVAPPLLNLKSHAQSADWRLDGETVTPSFSHLDRTAEISFAGTAPSAHTLSVSLDTHLLQATIQNTGKSFFAGRNVLLTKSKNNDLRWIRDWIRFHREHQAVDAVLLYDNGSTEYTLDDLAGALDETGIPDAIIMDWPYKFGPQGGTWDKMGNLPWDSDFCEYGILTHARRRFLEAARGVLHCDIDELVLSIDQHTVFDLAQRSKEGGVRFAGRWIEAIPNRATQSRPCFKDFGYVDVKRAPTTKKWAISPSRTERAHQWKTHAISGITLEEVEGVTHRHFLGISTGWKWDRTNGSQRLDPARHFDDSALARAMHSDGSMDTVFSRLGALNERLEELRAHISPQRRFERFIKRIWYYRPACLVFDVIMPSGIALAFELVANDSETTLMALGRDAASRYSLERATLAYSARADGKKDHRLLGRWPSEAPVAMTSGDCIQLIQRVITALDSPARPTQTVSMSGYWWDMRPNFGDALSPWIMGLLSGATPRNTIGLPKGGRALVALGSLLSHLQREGLDIWGTGLMSPLTETQIATMKKRPPRAIHAVRGHLTRNELIETLGWELPNVVGDPALLLPRYFQPQSPANAPSTGVTLVPHYSHIPLFRSAFESAPNATRPFEVLDVRADPVSVVTRIIHSRSIVSTSLHGIIIAQAYGIPRAWLNITDSPLTGNRFKFDDFFSTLKGGDAPEVQVGQNDLDSLAFDTLLEEARTPELGISLEALEHAFPEDFRVSFGASA